jgi:multidrug efflux pump subunit AcrA (membrane-fusion protein)
MDINTMKEAFGTVIEEKLPLMKEELMSDIVSYIDDKIETAQKSVEVEEAAAEEVVAKAEAEAEVESKTEEFDSMVVKFREELDAALATVEEQKSALSEATAKIEQIESSGAIKKSVESDESVDEEETVVKEAETSFWGNFYLPNDLIKSLGYDS